MCNYSYMALLPVRLNVLLDPKTDTRLRTMRETSKKSFGYIVRKAINDLYEKEAP